MQNIIGQNGQSLRRLVTLTIVRQFCQQQKTVPKQPEIAGTVLQRFSDIKTAGYLLLYKFLNAGQAMGFIGYTNKISAGS